MDIVAVATDIKESYLPGIESWRHEGFEERTEHLVWMLDGIVQGYVQHEKAHRWIGFVQGALVAQERATVADMKQINRG